MTRWLFHQSSSSLSLVSRLNSSRSSTSVGEEGLCSTEPPSLQHHSTIFFQYVETCTTRQHSYLITKCSMCLYANTHYKIPLQIQFLYLSHRENHCSLKTCCIIYVLIYKKFCSFILKCFKTILTFFTGHVPILIPKQSPECYSLAVTSDR